MSNHRDARAQRDYHDILQGNRTSPEARGEEQKKNTHTHKVHKNTTDAVNERTEGREEGREEGKEEETEEKQGRQKKKKKQGKRRKPRSKNVTENKKQKKQDHNYTHSQASKTKTVMIYNRDHLKARYPRTVTAYKLKPRARRRTPRGTWVTYLRFALGGTWVQT